MMPFIKKNIFKLTFTLLLILVVGMSWAQNNIPYDTTHRPRLYHEVVEQFESYANDSRHIVFLGNSITARADWSELLQIEKAINRGISGDITYGVLERLHEVTEDQPSKIFVLIGINDITHNIPDSLIVSNYRKIIRRIKAESPVTQIYFHTLLPVNSEFTRFESIRNKDEHILVVNEQLKEIAKETGITLIDLYPHFLDDQNRFDAQYTEDGLHANAAGYLVWKDLLEKGGYLK